MENEPTQISFEQVKELYKDMMKERAREKQRQWDKEYKKIRYNTDPEFRAKHLEIVKLSREKKKLEKEAAVVKSI